MIFLLFVLIAEFYSFSFHSLSCMFRERKSFGKASASPTALHTAPHIDRPAETESPSSFGSSAAPPPSAPDSIPAAAAADTTSLTDSPASAADVPPSSDMAAATEVEAAAESVSTTDATDVTAAAASTATDQADPQTVSGTAAAEEPATDEAGADAAGPGEQGDLTLAEQETEAEVVARRRIAELRARPRAQSASLGGFKRVEEDASDHYWQSVDSAEAAAALLAHEQQQSSPPSPDETVAHSVSANSGMPIAHTAHAEMANASAPVSAHDEL
jgi:hypothetical protein